MPTYFRRDDTVQNVLGQAIPNVSVTYYTQPSGNLATVYGNDSGTGGAISNPQTTNGFGAAAAYMLPGEYTITYSGAQIQTYTLPDQVVGGAGSSSSISVFAGTLQGTINGVNRVFTLTNNGVPLVTAPTQSEVTMNYPLVPGVGYVLTGVTVVYANAPQSGDILYAQGFTIS